MIYSEKAIGIIVFLRGEILNLTWSDIDFDRERIILRETENGEVKVLPCVGLAQELLRKLDKKRSINSFLLFPGTDPKKPIDFRSAWRVVVKRTGLQLRGAYIQLKNQWSNIYIFMHSIFQKNNSV